MSRGRFIAFDAIDGAGKTSQSRRLVDHLRAQGRKVVATREPGGSPVAESIRRIVLDRTASPDGLGELLLFNAARRDHVQTLVLPALESGRDVVCDRYVASTLAYQVAGRGIDHRLALRLHDEFCFGLWPDRTIILALDPAIAWARAASRLRRQNRDADRFEAEGLAFQVRLAAAFARLCAEREDCVAVDASGDEDRVFARVLAALA